jgi:hypothetical protein
MTHCRRCSTDLVHCHGTLVQHAEGDLECSDPGCAGRVAVHDFVILCDDVQARCCGDRAPESLATRRSA